MRLLRLVLALAGMFGLGPVASWAEAAEPLRFLVEKISVSGASGATAGRIVVASSLLTEGQSYTEDELRQAVYRIRRLPFVLDADFALEKGSERGRFELRITIEEPKKVFLHYSAGLDLSPAPPGTHPSLHDRFGDSYSLGLRQFVGASGVAYANVDQDRSAVVGYTRYGLFGRGASLDVSAYTDREGHSRQLGLFLAVPVVGNQAVLTSASWSEFEADPSPGRSWSQALYWRYDSTDDPLFARTGTVAETGARYTDERFDSHRSFQIEPGVFLASRTQNHTWSTSSWARRHWPLSARQSVRLTVAGTAAWNRQTRHIQGVEPPSFRSDQRQVQAGVDAGHLVRLDSWQNASTRRELWLETLASYSVARVHGDDLAPFQFETAGAAVQLSFRSLWGIVGLRLTYAKSHGRLL